jgi:DNA repair exonuclease SbcCD ATPase subunit
MEIVKIKEITVENLKAVSSFTAFFDGKSAHVTGANGIGKSTVIRTLTDRLRGLKPSIITKIGEKEGKTVLELTDGCRFEWNYNNLGKDELNYFTPASLKPVRRNVFKHICGQYFPNQFDINKFLTTSEPAKRLKMISELINIDLTEIQARYKEVFDARRDAKRDLKVLESQIRPKPELPIFEKSDNLEAEQKKIEDLKFQISSKKVGIEQERTALNELYLKNKAANDELQKKHNEDYQLKLNEWFESEKSIKEEIEAYNEIQNSKKIILEENNNVLEHLIQNYQGTDIGHFIDYEGIENYIISLPQPTELKEYIPTAKPELTKLELPDPMPASDNLNVLKSELEKLESSLEFEVNLLESRKAELSEINNAKQVYEIQMKQYAEFQKQVEAQQKSVFDLEQEVSNVLSEIKEIISGTKLPAEFSIDLTDKNDILFKPSENSEYLPITNETLASSAIYIAAFKLQANYLEAFRVAHFDVSYLDFENRQKVLKEAIAMNIQLITESPAMDESSMELQCKITED